MDIIGCMNALNKVGKYLLLAIVAINLVTVASGQVASQNIVNAVQTICYMSQTVLGAVVMMLIVLAGVTYAIGQVLGAETRARATVWATAMITGAIIGALIYIVTPPIVETLIEGQGYGQLFGAAKMTGNICNAQ